MALIDRIPKTGRNEFHKYDYATEADITAAVRVEMARRQLMLTPSVVDSKAELVGEKKSRLVTIRVRYTLEDGESGEQRTFDMLGEGSDSLDKAFYKAMTGATKYAVLKLFLIPTGDDPEKDEPRNRGLPRPSGTDGLRDKLPPASRHASSASPAAAAAPRNAQPFDRSLSFGFGSGKGKPISELDDKSLAWYASCLQRDLADASKAKWHDKTRQQFATLQAEQGYRLAVADNIELATQGEPDDGPPPHGDADAPF